MMKRSHVSPNVKRAMEALKNAPKATGRILSAKEIMDRSLALSEMAEMVERSAHAGKSGGRGAPRPLMVHESVVAAV